MLNTVGLLAVSFLAHRIARGGRAGTIALGRAGIKTDATLASDLAWRVAHRVAAPWLLVAAVAGYVLTGACIAYPIAAPAVGWPGGLVGAAIPLESVVIVAALFAVGGSRVIEPRSPSSSGANLHRRRRSPRSCSALGLLPGQRPPPARHRHRHPIARAPQPLHRPQAGAEQLDQRAGQHVVSRGLGAGVEAGPDPHLLEGHLCTRCRRGDVEQPPGGPRCRRAPSAAGWASAPSTCRHRARTRTEDPDGPYDGRCRLAAATRRAGLHLRGPWVGAGDVHPRVRQAAPTATRARAAPATRG